MKTWMVPAAAATALFLTFPAQASIVISAFDTPTAQAYMSDFGQTPNVGEDFEQLGMNGGAREIIGGLSTAVGTLDSIIGSNGEGTGTGGTVNSLANNTGTGVALRTGNVFGRTNQVPFSPRGQWFLDSNDTFGVSWMAYLGSGRMFDRVSFVIQDAGDVGAWVTVSDGTETEVLNLAAGGNQNGNGNVKLVEIVFGTAVSSANIRIENFSGSGQGASNRTNDGFGLDGMQISAVPLPTGVALLGLGLAGLAGVRRMQKRREAA